jgi:micrococcal nuclease
MRECLYTYRCKLIRVIDGDTIVANIDLGFDTWSTKTIRLSDINTPEIRTKNLDEKILGNIAKDVVINLLNKYVNDEGDVYFYLKSNKYDSFGRSLGVVYTPDYLNVNQYLLENGFAEIWPKP